MTPTEADYVFHWMLTISSGLFLLLCGFAIRFFRTRRSRKESR